MREQCVPGPFSSPLKKGPGDKATVPCTITQGCMSKADSSNADNARVYSSIPTDQIPTDSPHKFDAFLEPLINEIEEL